MTSPSAPRPGTDPPDPPRASDSIRPGDAPPAEAVTLADLIADTGPLPADAALECVQRLAERLTLTPRFSCATLGPADVLIDDDGGVWLRPDMGTSAVSPGEMPTGMDRLGRLLVFLATGNGGHLTDGLNVDAAALPAPLSTVAGRLFSRNGACYGSYAELASDAAAARGVAPPTVVPVDAAGQERVVENPVSKSGATPERTPAEPSRLPSLALALAIAGGAVVAYLIWQAS